VNDPDPPVRLLLVDDQDLLRTSLRTILDAQPGIEVVGEAGTGEEAVAAARDLQPDVVSMDVEMPGMNGLEATRQITAADLEARVLVLTTFDREDYLLEALRSGASGFVLKNSRPEQLVEAIRSVASGDALLAPEMTRAVIARAVAEEPVTAEPVADSAPVPPAGDGPVGGPDPLTERELEVLRLVAHGLSNDEIAAHLVVGRATVKTHVSNVLTKLHLRDRVQAVAYAHRHGLAPE